MTTEQTNKQINDGREKNGTEEEENAGSME